MYIYKENRCRTKVLWILKFGEVGGLGYTNFKFTICKTIIVFTSKTSFFPRLGALVSTLFLIKEGFAFKLNGGFILFLN